MTDTMLMPYAGSSGWSGSDTSRDRAEWLDSTGRTTERQNAALRVLANAGGRGATWKEIGEALGVHHGSASNVLTVLHKAGRIARLEDRRDRSHIYVLPIFVEGRATQEPGGNRRRYTEAEVARLVADAYAEGFMAAGGAA